MLVRRVGTEVVLDALFVADVDEDASEDTRVATLVKGDEHPALKHVLQESYRFEAHRLATGVRPRDDEDALLSVQLDVEWDDLLVVLRQRELQQGVDGGCPIQYLPVLEHRLDGLDVEGEMRLGTDEVDFRQKLVRLQDGGHLRAHRG